MVSGEVSGSGSVTAKKDFKMWQNAASNSSLFSRSAMKKSSPATEPAAAKPIIRSSRSYDNLNAVSDQLLPSAPTVKRTFCCCSPTTHAGSFRCHLHRSSRKLQATGTSTVTKPNNVVIKEKLATAVRMYPIRSLAGDHKGGGCRKSSKRTPPRPSRLSKVETAAKEANNSTDMGQAAGGGGGGGDDGIQDVQECAQI